MIRTWTSVAVAVVVLAGGFGVAGCQTMDPDIERYCAAYPPVQAWWERQPTSVTACNDQGQSTVLTFKGEGGEVLKTVETDVSGCITVPMRSGTKTIDWKTSDDKGAIPVPLLAGSLTGQWLPDGAREYARLCMSVDVDPGQPGLAYAFRTQAASQQQADLLVDSLIEGGPGTPVPPPVTVGLFVEAGFDGAEGVIRSSLPDDFLSFRIEQDGRPLADLASGLNVELTVGEAGWVTLTTVIPLEVLAARQTLVLRQRGRHDDRDGEVVLVF
jgi:hypothetical protein